MILSTTERVCAKKRRETCLLVLRKYVDEIITEAHSNYLVGPTVHTKNYQVYIYLFLLTIFGPIYYGPP